MATQAIDPSGSLPSIGTYRHLRGDLYEVFGTAVNANHPGYLFVVYRRIGESALYVRGVDDFWGELDDGTGGKVRRFTKVD